MKLAKTAKRALFALIISVLCLALFCFGASAVSLDEKGSISLTATDRESKEPVKDAVFRIYFIATAEMSGDLISYTYTEGFKNNGIAMGSFSDSSLPVHLATYATLNKLDYAEKSTDSNGNVLFGSLSCGAYLIVPADTPDGYLNPSPFLVSIPMRDETSGDYVFDISASPKIEAEKPEGGEKTYLSVKKQWNSTGDIPDSIKVCLVRDCIVIEAVELNNENNWYYRWDELDKQHSWFVIEAEVPEGYEASYDASQNSVVIINTSDDFEDETYQPEYPTSYPPDSPEHTTTVGEPENTTTPDELIDTGQLNWPVPVFAIAGLILFSIGWAIVNFSKKDEDTV